MLHASTPAALPAPFVRLLAVCNAHWPMLFAWVVLPLLIVFLPRGFHGNDDTLIMAVLRGGHPAPFVGNGFSLGLAWLYGHISEALPWYGLLLYGTVCATTHAGLRTIQILGQGKALVQRLWTGIAAALMLATLWAFSQHLTFTITAIAACGLGVVGFAVECRNNTLTWRKALAYGILIAAGYQLRPASGLATAASLGLPGILFLLWFLVKKRQEYAVAFLAATLPVALSIASNNLGPSFFSAEETAYRAYNDARGSIQGFDKYERLEWRNPQGLKEAGWNTRDYRSFMFFFNFDEDHFSLEKINKLAPLGNPDSFDNAGQVVSLLGLGGTYGWPLLACALLSVCLGGGGGPKRHFLGILAATGQALSIALVLIFFLKIARIPARICLPMLLIAALSGLAFAWWCMGANWLGLLVSPTERLAARIRNGVTSPPTWWTRHGGVMRLAIPSLLGIGLLGATGLFWVKREKMIYPGLWQQHGATLIHDIRQFAPEANDDVIVEYCCVLGFSNGVDPLAFGDSLPPRMVFLEWCPPSPFFYECLEKAGIKRGADILQDAHKRKDILFLLEDPFIVQLEQYAQGDIHHPVHFELAHDIHRPQTGLYRLVDGPSSRFHLDGCPPGSIYRNGSTHNVVPPTDTAPIKPVGILAPQ